MKLPVRDTLILTFGQFKIFHKVRLFVTWWPYIEDISILTVYIPKIYDINSFITKTTKKTLIFFLSPVVMIIIKLHLVLIKISCTFYNTCKSIVAFSCLPFYQFLKLWVEWLTDCCSMSTQQFSAISWREQVNFQWDNDEVCFILDNSPRMDMLPHSNALSWFRANQSLLFLHNAACLTEKQNQFHSLWLDPIRAWIHDIPNSRRAC